MKSKDEASCGLSSISICCMSQACGILINRILTLRSIGQARAVGICGSGWGSGGTHRLTTQGNP